MFLKIRLERVKITPQEEIMALSLIGHSISPLLPPSIKKYINIYINTINIK